LIVIIPLEVKGPAESTEAHRGAASTPQLQPELVVRFTVTVEACACKDNVLGEKAYVHETAGGGTIPIE